MGWNLRLFFLRGAAGFLLRGLRHTLNCTHTHTHKQNLWRILYSPIHSPLIISLHGFSPEARVRLYNLIPPSLCGWSVSSRVVLELLKSFFYYYYKSKNKSAVIDKSVMLKEEACGRGGGWRERVRHLNYSSNNIFSQLLPPPSPLPPPSSRGVLKKWREIAHTGMNEWRRSRSHTQSRQWNILPPHQSWEADRVAAV